MDIFDTKYNYEERFVAFIDILGFKDIIKVVESNLNADNSQLKTVKSILNFMLEETEESHYSADLPVYELRDDKMYERELGNPRLTYISDCMIISTDGNLDGFKALSRKLHKISADLAVDGVFCRGAITKGKVFHHGQILFGSAYVKAYQLEQTAIYPRIIVDPDIIDVFDYSKVKVPLSPAFYSKDESDGLFYLNFTTWQLYPPYCFDFITFLLRTREHIVNSLNKTTDEKILKKLDWLQQEFNRNVQKYIDIFKLVEVAIIQHDKNSNLWR